MRPYFVLVARMISTRWPLASFGSVITTRRPLAFAFHARGVGGRLADAAPAVFEAPAALVPAVGAPVVAPLAADPAGAGTGAGATPAAPVAGAVALGLNQSPPHRRKAWTMYV